MAKVPFAVWTDMPNVLKRRPLVKRVLRSAWLRYVFSNATVVMGTGVGALNALEQMGCARHKLFNFPYPVDTQYFSRDPGGRRSEKGALRILSVGRLVESKAHDMAIGAIAGLLQNGTNLPEIEYTIVGDGPERSRLEELARRAPSTCKVNLPGWLEQEEILSLLHSADLFLHPSREEPYGVSVLEAMAAGLPIVVSDACGVTVDRFEHGINGLVHQAGNMSDLENQLSIALSNAALRRSMGQAAKQTAEAWSLSRSVDLVTQLVGQLSAAANGTRK
jgi:glycosyltransferase involved in cell wall biosynthesis